MKELDFSHISLSLIIPVYNEEKSVQVAIDSNLKALKKYLTNYELIIVNDGSVDNSQSLINDYIKGKENFITIEKQKNQGIGSAIRVGIEKAKYDYVLPVPVDCPLDDNTLYLFLCNLENVDVLVGYRPKRVGYSLRMKLNSYVFHKLISWLFKINLKDYNWIHLYKRKIFFEEGIKISSNGIMMLAEVLIKSSRKNRSLKEIEIVQRERLTGTATASKLITVIKTIKEIVLLYKEIRNKSFI